MTVIKRGNSKFWYVQFQIAGRTIIRSARTSNRKVAEQFEARLRTQVHAERFLGQKPSITFEQALNRFIQSKENTASYRNLQCYQRLILKSIRGSKPLEQTGSEDIEQYHRDRLVDGVSSQTIKHGLNLIRCACKLAKKQGYRVADLSFPSVRVPRGRTRYLAVDEERRLLAELDPARESRGLAPFAKRKDAQKRAMQDAYDLTVILLDTGARYGEITHLQWNQIDLDNRLIRLWRPKVRNEGIIFMTARVFGILSRRHAAGTGQFVFINKRGGPRGHTVQSIRKAMARAGLHDCTVHTLRHTHATRLIQNGLSIYEVQAVLGHTDVKTTMRYAHLEQAKVTARARDVIDGINGRERQDMPRLDQ